MAAQFGAMAKRFHSGKASQNGIIAAMSAQEGLTGVRDVLEAEYGGFCSTYGGKYDLSWANKGLGKEFEMRHNGFKRYSSLASSQTSVDAMRMIREKHGIKGEDVAKVVIKCSTMVHVHCGWPYRPMNPPETIAAQMNLPYTAAVTLLEGNAFIDQYKTEKLLDPKIMNLADRIECEIDPTIDAMGPDEMRYIRATVFMKSGESFSQDVPYRSGHWKNPMSDEVLQAKFVDLASRGITKEAVDKVSSIVWKIDTNPEPASALGVELQKVKA
jgi:2-methylcitrate dehydratase PrpD